ncbi:MAG: nitrate/nitrite transporter NrtS [Pseudomonadota bacterium]
MTFLEHAMSKSVAMRAAKVSAIVGTLLLVINQGDVVLAGTGIDWIKALLTYLVPYGVSTYSAVAAARERE